MGVFLLEHRESMGDDRRDRVHPLQLAHYNILPTSAANASAQNLCSLSVIHGLLGAETSQRGER